MARIDLHQRISQGGADRIKAWLYKQEGVKYVLVNPAPGIAMFSFAPVQNDGNRIVREFVRWGTTGQCGICPAGRAGSGCPAGF